MARKNSRNTTVHTKTFTKNLPALPFGGNASVRNSWTVGAHRDSVGLEATSLIASAIAFDAAVLRKASAL